MTKQTSVTYSSLVTIATTVINPTTIIGGSLLNAGLEVSVAGETVVNAGTIKGTAGSTGVLLDVGGGLTNASGGLITGYYAVNSQGASASIVNAGSISGVNTGVYLQAGGISQILSLNNQLGALVGGGIVGVASAGAPLTVVNAGTIEGFSGVGISLYLGGTVTNQTGGAIAGGIGSGAPLTVLNAGSITGAAVENGVALAGGSVSNQTGGTVRAGLDGIYGHGSAVTVINAGIIVGSTANKGGAGVFLTAGGTLTNQTKCLISGHDGIYSTGGNSTLTNAGTLTGVIGLLFGAADPGNETVINAGTIIGTGGTAVAFGGTGSNLLVLESGSAQKGVDLGAIGATNTVELVGTVGAPVTATYGSTGLINFQTVAFGPAATNDGTLVISSTLSIPGTISGFTGVFDAINLTGLSDAANNASLTFDTQTDLLIVTSGTASVPLQLDNEDYSTIHFVVQKLAAGGTEVQALPPPTVSSVTTAPVTGTVGFGKTVTFSLTFTETVTVTGGVPSLLLNDGGTALYKSGSGTGVLTFVYTVGAGQDTPDLTVTGSALNGATIQHGAGNLANMAGAVTNPAGTVQIDTTNLLLVQDTTKKAAPITTAGVAYTGKIADILHSYIATSADSLNLTTSTPGWFLQTGSGNDAINVSNGGGNNVLEASTGSNFLTGGSGTDSFFADVRGVKAATWNTIVGFHAGDTATVWGITTSDFTLTHLDNAGAPGYTGLTLDFISKTKPQTNLTMSGYSGSDLTAGNLVITYGTTANAPGVPGSTFMQIVGH